MTSDCALCGSRDARPDCYVRVELEERPSCRACWEQLLLDPRRVVRAYQGQETGLRPKPASS